MEKRKLTLHNLAEKKGNEKVTYITSYDFPTARIAEQCGIDLILVGDSVANNVLGHSSTNPMTMDEMLVFSKAVRRGAPNTFVIGDMPFLSYQPSDRDAVINAGRFIQEAEMDAVKCEGGIRMADRVKAISDAGIAVMGHIGYTPQSGNLYGIVQGKSREDFNNILKDALALQKNGAFAILLEAVPAPAAGQIARELRIPIYGIGSGGETDGNLAIMHDVIGLGGFKSKFVKNFGNTENEIKNAITEYIRAVKSGEFPGREHSYNNIDEDLLDEINSRKNQYTSQ